VWEKPERRAIVIEKRMIKFLKKYPSQTVQRTDVLVTKKGLFFKRIKDVEEIHI
jgi:hypothetical protein